MGIDYKAYASSEIIENSDLFSGLSDEIWKLSELSLKEFQSTELYCELLEKLGFSLERNLSGIPTAFCGRYGSGQPTIGILGEFDALSGLSQRENVLEREELVVGGAGHGCGHNLLGAGALAAAYGIKRYLEKSGHGGTIIFFGCPGEEGGSGKAFMAREGAWRSLDCALSWHPDDRNEVVSGTNNSCIQKEYIFSGLSAHAAEAPERGRSALDAVELMNIGVQFLREHMSSSCRIHYSITDAGGVSPNVVQSRARVLYMIRSIDVADCIALTKRVDSIARGAALMTETEQIERFIDGCANLLPNFSLEKVLHDNLCLAKTASFDESDLSLAKQFIETFEYKRTGTPFVRDNTPDFVKQFVIGQCSGVDKPLCDFVLPLFSCESAVMGSTDVGDVSRETPTAQIRAATFPCGSPCHSWQNVSCGKSAFAHKGMLYAARALAGTAVDLFENPALLAEARAEFDKRIASCGGYLCPIPDDAVPTPID